MQILSEEHKAAITQLINDSNLISSDLDLNTQHFFGLFTAHHLSAIAGLEIYGNNAVLRSVCVDAGFKSKGLGKQIVKEAEAWACKHSISTIYLLTETAEHFFNKLGYKSINRTEAPESVQQSMQFAQLCPSSAVCMIKQLN